MITHQKKISAALKRRLNHRDLTGNPSPIIPYKKILFKQQLDLIECEAKFASACCSVRSGKTYTAATDLIHTAQTIPESVCLYLTLARSSAKRIMWPTLKRLIKQHKLKAIFNNSELTITFPDNGSTIYLLGANTEQEMDKLRGLSRVALAYIDEAQVFRMHLKELITDVIMKRLYDLNGRLRLIGTPGHVLTGYFYETRSLPEWTQFHWTMHDNIWLLKQSGKTAHELIEQDCRTRGCTLDDPSIQRECFGRWVQDTQSLILTYSEELNHYEQVPQDGKVKYNYLLGCDLGWNDQNSLSVLSWSDSSPITYLIHEKLTSHQLTDDLAKDIEDLRKRYSFSRMVVDAGGLGKTIVEDLRARYGLPLEAADKREKMATYALLNNALRTGMFKAKKTSVFAQDCNLLEKDFDNSTPDKIAIKGHSDAVDSALYAFKFSPAYTYRAPEKKLEKGTEAFDKREAEKIMQHNFERLEQERKMKETNDLNWNTNNQGIASWNQWDE